MKVTQVVNEQPRRDVGFPSNGIIAFRKNGESAWRIGIVKEMLTSRGLIGVVIFKWDGLEKIDWTHSDRISGVERGYDYEWRHAHPGESITFEA